MTDAGERLRRVRALFDIVMDLPAEDRPAYLDAHAEWEADVRDEVRVLIVVSERTEARWSTPPGLEVHAAGDEDDPLVGRRFGAYDIVRLVGLGGMGAVYEGVRADDQFRKRVAIKLVQSGLHSEQTLARFRRERQILANLQHKNIATLLDGGVGPDGQPFLVMEYVEGEPITTWCDRRQLPVRERLALFRQVCDAVRHAHQNLVIHRDIKPGNILVTTDGSVKLLDFGVAKLISADGEDEADMALTRGGQRAYTPEYASPEQIRGDGLTTASDVYSLGVVLFELLTGRRPHVVQGGTITALERAVLAGSAPRSSAVVTDDAATRRGERDARRLRARLAGELDAIVLLALRPEPHLRYPSVEALADDVRRHLDGRTVHAQQGWTSYRVRKFLGRNRVMIGAAALVLVSLVVGVVTTGIEARRARQAQARAERVNQFLSGLLGAVRPATGGRDVPVSELLETSARRLRTELADEPEVRGDLEAVIGDSYMALGRYDEAEPHLRTAVHLRAIAYGDHSMQMASALDNLAMVYLDRGELPTADSLFRTALAMHRQSSPRPDTLTATLLDNLGSVQHSMGHPAESERSRREALDLRVRVLGQHGDEVVTTMNNLAVALGEQNRWAAAESLQRAALGIAVANHPEPTPEVANLENALATALDIQGKFVPAESLYVDVIALRARLLGRDHPDYLFTLSNFAGFLFDRGQYARAEQMAREILAQRGKTLPESQPVIGAALQTLGRCLDREGRTAEGARALSESVELRRKYLGSDHWLTASGLSVLGDHFLTMHDYPRAERLLLEAEAILQRNLPAGHPRAVANEKHLVALYEATDRPALAAKYRARIPAPKS